MEPATLHKKWSFPLWISSANVTKSAGNCAGTLFCAVENTKVWDLDRLFAQKGFTCLTSVNTAVHVVAILGDILG